MCTHIDLKNIANKYTFPTPPKKKANGIAASTSELDVNHLNNNDSTEPQRKSFLISHKFYKHIKFNLYIVCKYVQILFVRIE